MSKQVIINNVTYKSLAAAHRELAPEEVSFALARKRVSRGWPVNMAVIVPPIAPTLRRIHPSLSNLK